MAARQAATATVRAVSKARKIRPLKAPITLAVIPWIRAFGYTRARRWKGKKALGNCVPDCVLLIAHVTTPYVHLPLGASPGIFRLEKAVDFTPAVYFHTQAAVTRVRELLSVEKDNIGLRIGVRERGCNGLSYTLDYAKDKKKFDEEVVQDGVRILIDSKAQLTLLGTEMDFVADKLGSEFVFNNPNIKGTCGCGESFHL